MNPMNKKIKLLKANQLLIEDLHGRPRIFLDAGLDQGGVSITLLSEGGGEVRLSIDEHNHGTVSIRHPSGTTGACLAVMSSGQSGLELRTKEGLPSIVLASAEKKGQQPVFLVKAVPKKKS